MFHIILAKGKILTGNNKAWFGNSANKAVELANFSHLSSMFKTITNPPRTPADDTVANWRACGTGLAYYEVSGQLIDQPTQYGCVLNFVYTTVVFQLWLPCHQTIICYRTGANNGWWNVSNHSTAGYGYWVRTAYQISGNYDGVPNGTGAEKIPYSNLYLTAPVSRRNRAVMTLYEGDGAGDALAIDGSGLTIIGGGESSRTMMARVIQRDNLRAGDERMYVCSDNAIHFVTNVNTIQSDVSKNTHVTSVLDSAGKLTLPGGITAKFVNCPGGTLTAGLTTSSIIIFTENGKTAEGWMIPFIFKMKNYETRAIYLVDGDNYGCGLILEAGGTTILSGGEAGTNLMKTLIAEGNAITPSTEAAYVASDGNAYVCTGCQTIANRKTFTFGSDGSLTVPGAIRGNVTGNCSGSSGSCTGNAASATKLATARNIQVNLASTSAASFNGTGNATPGVTGILGAGNGGLGNNRGRIQIGAKSAADVSASGTAEGAQNVSNANNTHAEGYNNKATKNEAHAEGAGNTASGGRSHAEGTNNTVSGDNSHVEGQDCTCSAANSHAGGWQTQATGSQCYSTCASTRSTAYGSFSCGTGTIANYHSMFACGAYNVINGGDGTRLAVGGGTGSGSYDGATGRMNLFRVSTSGVYGYGSYRSSGADYAEMFEWLDGNPNNEDRVGRFVTLDGRKIRFANSEDDFILGIISGNPTVCANSYEDQWCDIHERDIFGRAIWEDVDVEMEVPGDEPYIYKEHRMKLNPNYDKDRPYVGRSSRPEWDAVGMIGQLVVIDDGTCEVNKYCRASDDGIATTSAERTQYRVMERLDDTHIKILIF